MIKIGHPIYLGGYKMFSKPGPERVFLGWSHNYEDIPEGTELVLQYITRKRPAREKTGQEIKRKGENKHAKSKPKKSQCQDPG